MLINKYLAATKTTKATKAIKTASMTCVLSLLCCVQFSFAQVLESNFDGMTFVKISAGEYQFGSPSDQALRLSNELALPIKISHSFWMGKYEVSQAEWLSVMDYNPSTYQALASDQNRPE